MFTGIVEEVGLVKSLEQPSDHVGVGRLTVAAQKVLEGSKLGDSIAINGTCLTIVAFDGDTFDVDLAQETLRRTNLGALEQEVAVVDIVSARSCDGEDDRAANERRCLGRDNSRH